VAVRTDIHAHIGEVVIDRPPVNALDSKAWNELAAVIANMGSLPEIDRGAMGGASHLLRMIPLHKVRAAFFTGGRIDAAEGYLPQGQGHGEVRTH
jgi:enoyl-CoA hydratase/carnithine racemase